MNTLLEPAGAPSFIPDLMLVDDEDACTDAWAYSAPGLASFAPLGASSAPVPIAAPAVRLASPSDELVDSLESTQTMLGASLHDATMRDDAAARMHFVPIPVQQPAQPQPYLFQQQLRPHMQHRAPLAPADEALYGGYGAVAHVQQAQPTHVQPVQQGWSTQVESSQLAKAYHAAGSSGISAFELQHGYSTQFGQGLAIPSAVRSHDDRMRRALSHEALQVGGYHDGYGKAALAAIGDADSHSEGSDLDILSDHELLSPRGLPISHSAPSASLMVLERSGSSRRVPPHPAARAGISASSPRTLSLKVKAVRPRPPAASRAAAALAAGAEAGVRSARAAARRSASLSATVEEEGYATSDSEAEPLPNSGSREERRGVVAVARTPTAAAHNAAGAAAKKKHNPWSLTETEALVEGVRLLGPSKWAEIKKLAVGGIADLLASRSAVDLKDKWRNLTRVAKLPKSVLKARAHKSTSDIPLDLLLTVKDLMEMSRD